MVRGVVYQSRRFNKGEALENTTERAIEIASQLWTIISWHNVGKSPSLKVHAELRSPKWTSIEREELEGELRWILVGIFAIPRLPQCVLFPSKCHPSVNLSMSTTEPGFIWVLRHSCFVWFSIRKFTSSKSVYSQYSPRKEGINFFLLWKYSRSFRCIWQEGREMKQIRF